MVYVGRPKYLGKKDVEFTGIDTIPMPPPGVWESEMRVTFKCTEFTCRCPITGQPDWAEIEVWYVPKELLLESKSFKLYLETYRDVGIFHEHLAAKIVDDLEEVLNPKNLMVTVRFNARGGIAISATASCINPEEG